MKKNNQPTANPKRDSISSEYPNIYFIDDVTLDEAIVGVAERINLNPVVVYDVDKILEIYMNIHGMSDIDALEMYNYNLLGAWIGEETPLFLTKF